MPRRCQVNGCTDRGTHLEGWRVPAFDKLVVVWFCQLHHEQSIEDSERQFDGSGV